MTDLTTDALCASGPVRALEWRSAGYDGQTLEASALGLKVFYRVHGKPGCWTLTSPGASEYVHTPGYETRAYAQAAAQADYERRILAALTPARQTDAEQCGCGDKACLACFPAATPTAQEAVLTEGELDEAWKSGFNAGFGEAKLTTNPPQPSEKVAVALKELLQAVCGETGFAACVRQDSGRAYPWPALDAAEAKAQAALRALKGGDA